MRAKFGRGRLCRRGGGYRQTDTQTHRHTDTQRDTAALYSRRLEFIMAWWYMRKPGESHTAGYLLTRNTSGKGLRQAHIVDVSKLGKCILYGTAFRHCQRLFALNGCAFFIVVFIYSSCLLCLHARLIYFPLLRLRSGFHVFILLFRPFPICLPSLRFCSFSVNADGMTLPFFPYSITLFFDISLSCITVV